MKTSKVAEILGVREYTSPKTNKTIFYLMLRMENGDVGDVGKPSRDSIKVGDQLTYDLIDRGEKGNSLQLAQPQGSQYGAQTNGQAYTRNSFAENKGASFALSYAKDLAVAYNDRIPTDKVAETTLKIADKFLEWLNKNQ